MNEKICITMRIKRLLVLVALDLGLALAMGLFALVGRAAPGNPALYPARNGHTAPVTTSVSITYDEAISVTTVTSHTFAVHAMQTGLVTGAHGVTGSTIVVTPTHAFHAGELVQATATSHTLNITGEHPISTTVWQFRTAVQASSGYFGSSAHDTFGSGGAAVLGDVDGDGDLDALVARDSAPEEVWLNDGDGNFGYSPHDTFGGDGIESAAALGDVDGDGDLDAVVANSLAENEVWLNDGSGDFEASTVFSASAASLAVVLGDVDGDGDLDAVITNHASVKEVWLNDGSGDFGAVPHHTFGATTAGNSVALGDVDGDGDLDALLAQSAGLPQEVWLNDGSGYFGPSHHDTFGGSVGPLALGDVDGDGDLDALTSYNISPPHDAEVWLNDGSGHFVAHDAFSNGGSKSVILGDVDGDGDLDAVVGNHADDSGV
jgi:hypothetical protein